MIHPARLIPFHELRRRLDAAKADRLISEKVWGPHSIWCYTPATVYAREWDEITTLARGLIVDNRAERVVATPFPKFFNWSERTDPIPDVAFDVFTKEDGSLIIIWHDGDRWRTATKGSLNSDQSRAAEAWMAHRDLSVLTPGDTYLAEWVGPSNKIVVPYPDERLIMLGAYDGDGYEWHPSDVEILASRLGWQSAARHQFASLQNLVSHAEGLPHTQEGFVIRFADGTRLKVKGAEYRRIHALISRCTPLGVWEAMMAGDSMFLMRDQLPDEFTADFDAIVEIIEDRIQTIIADVEAAVESVDHLSDKDVGLRLHEWPEPVRNFLFSRRKHGDLLEGRSREQLFRAVRPTGNDLPGYTPSYAMNRVMEELVG